jgi:hypothetical protein
MKITILDPAMCCSTGVCGTDIDDNLIQTAANTKWLKSLGHDVHRHNISNDAEAFKNYPDALNKLQKEGTNSLPYILIDDQLVMSGTYPTKSEWETFMNSGFDQSLKTVKLSGSAGSSCSGDSCC